MVDCAIASSRQHCIARALDIAEESTEFAFFAFEFFVGSVILEGKKENNKDGKRQGKKTGIEVQSAGSQQYCHAW